MQLSIYIHLKFLVDLQIFQPKNPPIHMQNTVDILPSHRSCQQELTICIARFLVDLQIFSIASKTKKSSYPLAIPCRFVDFSNMFKNPPIHLQNTVAFLTSNRRGFWELIIYIAQFLVDLQIFPITSIKKILLSIGNSQQICRFFKYNEKSTYPFVKHCRYSGLSQKLLVGTDYRYSAIPCRIVDFPNIIQKSYLTDTPGLFQSYISHVCTEYWLYLTNISPTFKTFDFGKN